VATPTSPLLVRCCLPPCRQRTRPLPAQLSQTCRLIIIIVVHDLAQESKGG
jgi:hypothetical protein